MRSLRRFPHVAIAARNGHLLRMSAAEIIERIKALPVAERAQIARYVVEQDDSWIPDEFRQAMADVGAGRFVEMDTALRETPPERFQ